MSRKASVFWPILGVLVLTDCSTKRLVVDQLSTDPGPHPLLGEWLRVTLAYNPDAAFNLSLGGASRVVFSLAAVVAVAMLSILYRKTEPGGWLRAAAIALVAGGALGNLLDRLLSPRGVVDFIDFGFGATRFWTFNIADVGVTIGAVLLACILWQEDTAAEEAAG